MSENGAWFTQPARLSEASLAPSNRIRDAVVLGAVYFSVAMLAIHLSRQPGSVGTVWFANAVGVAVLASRPMQHWAELLAVVVAASLLAHLVHGDPVALSASFLPANGLEVLIGAWLVRRAGGVERFTAGAGALIRVLIAGALVAPLIGATLGAGMIHLHGIAPFGPTWIDWYIGSVLGAIAMLPVALEGLRKGWRVARSQALTWPTAAFALVCIGVVFAIAKLQTPRDYIMLPVIGAALALPLLPAFAMALLVVLGVSAALAFGVMTPVVPNTQWRQVLIEVTVVAAVLPAQLLAVVVTRLRSASSTLSALMSATSELAAFVDNRLIFRVVNRAHDHYFGQQRGSVIGRSMAELIPNQRYETLVVPNMRRALAGQVARFRAAIDYPGVGRRTMDVTYQPAFDDHERQIGVVMSAHDVTELVATQTELERSLAELRSAHESLEQFVRIASHDLREPLNTMVQFSVLMRDDHGDELPHRARLYLEHLCNGSLRMRTMLDDLLSFVRLDPSQQLSLQPLGLNRVVAQALEALHAAVATRTARIEVAPLPQVLGHESLLTLLFQNLISNAIKFVPPERTPHVRVSAQADEAGVVVTIEDNGIGIEAEHLPQLFTPFRRLHARRKFEGTGLGLAISKRIALAHGGSIGIESTPESGSRVRVRLQHAA